VEIRALCPGAGGGFGRGGAGAAPATQTATRPAGPATRGGPALTPLERQAKAYVSLFQLIANYREIIAVEGVDIIHTGRTDIARAIGVPGEQFHPRVLEVERRIVEATLEAGKQASLLYPLTEQGMELAADLIQLGVRIFALDMDYRVLHRALPRLPD